MDKKLVRMRRAKKTRCKIKELLIVRLSVHKTPRHIYAQLIDFEGKVLGCVSSLQKQVKEHVSYGGNIEAAKVVGKLIAVCGKALGITKVAFDRSGFGYHGRVKALADAARSGGLEF